EHILSKETKFLRVIGVQHVTIAINFGIKVPASFEKHFGSALKTLAKENLIEGSGLRQWVDTH
ncbi:10862_t:CDS:2, partial [Gigaspora margarita]